MNNMSIPQKIKIVSVASALFIVSFDATAQYYYKDIITTQQIGGTYQQYKLNAVSRVNVSAFDRNIPVNDAVVIQQTVNTRQNSIITYTKVPDADENWLKSYYNEKGQLVKTTDSTEEIVAHTLYQYNDKGLLSTISNRSVPKNNPALTEFHQWVYNSANQPEKMIKIKNATDTTVISFTTDEKGNIGEEKALRKGVLVEKIYYYYDDKNRLTDIARYNKRADKILPDYVFEYNEQGQVTTTILFPEGMPGNYQTWRYIYGADGLKRKEQCYNKQKELVGRVEYNYQMNK
jgi:hypothetical protein